MIRDPKAILFSDSDGVICDFHRGATEVLGRPFNNKTRAEDGAKINAVKEFWQTLPPMHDFHIYWHVIGKYHPHILTAVPSDPWKFDWQQVEQGKREWYHRHLPEIPQSHIHIVLRREKQDFARNGMVRNILIDDHEENIREFEAAGGIGIHHVSAKVTIIKLKELGYY